MRKFRIENHYRNGDKEIMGNGYNQDDFDIACKKSIAKANKRIDTKTYVFIDSKSNLQQYGKLNYLETEEFLKNQYTEFLKTNENHYSELVYKYVKIGFDKFGLSFQDLTSKRRKTTEVMFRATIAYIIKKKYPNTTLRNISKIYGVDDHSKPLHYIECCTNFLVTDDAIFCKFFEYFKHLLYES